ncbi:hypothetical protein LXA43DRAFT_594370 [Ganoderma leucocontextum]|nr:hypothetical protein LXA43DRAFT_594370 [Ganoderma leucocontextum]
MPPKRSPTHAGTSRGAGFGSSSPPVDVDLPQSTPRGPKSQFKGPIDHVFSYALTPLGTHYRRPTPEPDRESNGEDSSSTASSSEMAATCLDPSAPPATSTLSGPTNCIQGAVPTTVHSCAIAPPAVTLQDVAAQPNPAADRPTGTPTDHTEVERTHPVWMFGGDIPSITCTSPTPPPVFRPALRALRRPPNLTNAHNALRLPERHRSRRSRSSTDFGIESERDNGDNSDSGEDDDDDSWIPGLMAKRYEISSDIGEPTGSTVVAWPFPQTEAVPAQGPLSWAQRRKLAGDPPTAGLSALRKSSHGRTIADYDRTNARIRALNAELLADPGLQPLSHQYRSQLRTSACRTLRSGSGAGVRYLDVPRAAAETIMAVRARGWATRTSSAADTGIVDISDSESSQFESDEEGEFGRTPGGTESEAPKAETEAEALSDPPVYGEIPRERPEQAANSATTPAEPEDRVSMASPCSSITDPTAPTDAHGPQWQRFRTVLSVHDRVAEDDRLQPGHLPVLPQNGTPTSSTLPPSAPKGKKRARDPDTHGGPPPGRVLGTPGITNKDAPSATLTTRHSESDGSLPVTTSRISVETSDGLAREGKRRKTTLGATSLTSRTAYTSDSASRNRLDTPGPSVRLPD